MLTPGLHRGTPSTGWGSWTSLPPFATGSLANQRLAHRMALRRMGSPMVRSNEQEWVSGGPDAEVGVVLEPLQGHTAEEVAQLARERGASDVVVLSAGMV